MQSQPFQRGLATSNFKASQTGAGAAVLGGCVGATVGATVGAAVGSGVHGSVMPILQ